MKKEKTVERINQTLSIKSRSEEALKLEKRKREITEELEKLVAEYARATGKKSLARRSSSENDRIYSSITGAIKDVLEEQK